jgi:hypothetical protein
MTIAPLSQSYADARTAFLDAAAAAGARIESHPHPLQGLHGDDLFVDVAEVGPADADRVIVIVSGTHGVEGYCGSALQTHHLSTLDAQQADAPTLVFLHALNPFGFSWVRRVNEDNVDLNRNFVDWSQPLPQNPEYADVADLLTPASWSPEEQERTLLGLMGKLDEYGSERMQAIISGGQYDHPTGVFHGGTGPVWSHRWLRQWSTARLANARRVAIVDVHTGLGPWGHGELISSERPDTPGFRRQAEWWPDVVSIYAGSVSAAVSGDWVAAAPEFAPHAEVTGITIEYGTVDTITVLQSLRADAVLHAHGDPSSPAAAAIRAQVRAAFLDDDPAWLEALWPRYRQVVTAAVERLT